MEKCKNEKYDKNEQKINNAKNGKKWRNKMYKWKNKQK